MMVSEQNPLSIVHKYHNFMNDENVVMAYEGEINYMITNAFTGIAKKSLNKADNEEDYVRNKRLYHVLVECLQNICKYSKDVFVSHEEIRPGSGIVMVIKEEDSFEIITGNRIENDDKLHLESILSELNSMTPEQIREYYKRHLKDVGLSEKGGAGLGFIDIIKKTGNAIDYNFEPINDKDSFFVMKVQIN